MLPPTNSAILWVWVTLLFLSLWCTLPMKTATQKTSGLQKMTLKAFRSYMVRTHGSREDYVRLERKMSRNGAWRVTVWDLNLKTCAVGQGSGRLACVRPSTLQTNTNKHLPRWSNSLYIPEEDAILAIHQAKFLTTQPSHHSPHFIR